MKESDLKEKLGIHSEALDNILIELKALNHLSNRLSNFITQQRRNFSSKEDRDRYYEMMYFTQVLDLALNTTTDNLEERVNESRNLKKELNRDSN